MKCLSDRQEGVAAVNHQDLVPHLFRTEYSKIASVLVKGFGFAQIDVAEDIASETFLAALESWSFKGVPNNPTAWLYAVAKNKANTHLTRAQKVVESGSTELETISAPEISVDLSSENIHDCQLRMIFTVCHPSISRESQVGLALRLLCGFGIEEIADAFLTSKETINKRLFRAKETLRQQSVQLEFPNEGEMEDRVAAVLATLYLLFSEGYHSGSQPEVLREDLCHEAMRLAGLLMEHASTNLPQTRALLALMCFHASRFPARRDESGEMVLYAEQDELLWDQALVSRGAELLRQAAEGTVLSKYHIEASIAYWQSIREDTPEKWDCVLMLHNQLLQIEYSPIAALNRTYALAKVKGNYAAIVEAEKLQLTSNHFYFTLLGELYKTVDPDRAKENLIRGLALAKSVSDQQTIQRKLDRLIQQP